MRTILLNPDVAGTNAGQPAPEATPTQSAPVAPVLVTIAADQLQRYAADQARLRELEAAQSRIAEEAEQRRLAEVAQRQGAEQALAQQQAQVEAERQARLALQNRYLTRERDATLATALGGMPIRSPEAAQQVQTLLRDRFEARENADGSVNVVEVGTGRPAADVIREALGSPAFAHFLNPSTQGGSGANPGTPAPTTGQTAAPATLGQQLLAQARSTVADRPRWMQPASN